MVDPEDWPDDFDASYHETHSPTCKFCGKPALEWVDVGGGRWRLYEGMKLHVCPKPSAKEAFKDCP